MDDGNTKTWPCQQMDILCSAKPNDLWAVSLHGPTIAEGQWFADPTPYTQVHMTRDVDMFVVYIFSIIYML